LEEQEEKGDITLLPNQLKPRPTNAIKTVKPAKGILKRLRRVMGVRACQGEKVGKKLGGLDKELKIVDKQKKHL